MSHPHAFVTDSRTVSSLSQMPTDDEVTDFEESFDPLQASRISVPDYEAQIAYPARSPYLPTAPPPFDTSGVTSTFLLDFAVPETGAAAATQGALTANGKEDVAWVDSHSSNGTAIHPTTALEDSSYNPFFGAVAVQPLSGPQSPSFTQPAGHTSPDPDTSSSLPTIVTTPSSSPPIPVPSLPTSPTSPSHPNPQPSPTDATSSDPIPRHATPGAFSTYTVSTDDPHHHSLSLSRSRHSSTSPFHSHSRGSSPGPATSLRFLPPTQAMATSDSAGVILTANEGWCRTFGVGEAEVVGRSALGFIAEPYRSRQETFLKARGKVGEGRDAVVVCGKVVRVVKGGGRSAAASLWLKERWVGVEGQVGAGAGVDAEGVTDGLEDGRGEKAGEGVRREKRERIYMWVFEEIKENKVTLVVTGQGKILSAMGASEEIFGYTDDELPLKRLSDLIPSLRPNPGTPGTPMTPSTFFSVTSGPQTPGGPINWEAIDKLKFFGGVTRQGLTVPVIAKVVDEEAAWDADGAGDGDPLSPTPPPVPPGARVVQVISMPTIAGVVTANGETGVVESCNTVFAKYLFGVSSKDVVGKVVVTEMVPQFWTLVQRMQGGGEGEGGAGVAGGNGVTTIRSAFSTAQGGGESVPPSPYFPATPSAYPPTPGHYDGFSATPTPTPTTAHPDGTPTPHRAVKTTGVVAYHRDGTAFNVDVQIREVKGAQGGTTYAMWVTYDRFAGARQAVLVRHEAAREAAGGRGDGGDAIAEGAGVPERTDTDSPAAVGRARDGKKKTILDYEVMETIGEGAYGFVKHVVRRGDAGRRVYVLKYVIKTRILVDTWIRDRELGSIPQEIHVLNYLRKHPHPCVCRMTEYFEDEEYYYVEMARHGVGMDLFDYIEFNQNMSEGEIKHVFHQVALAVQHLHRHSIVHRDIKDENIILDEHNNVQLIDFGSSAYYREGKKFDTFCGTLDYAAPEVLTGHKYDGPPQDIWALGILLYTLIYKENPYYNIDEIIGRALRIPFVLSRESLDLIQFVLNRDVHQRPTIDQVLAHPWFRAKPNPDHSATR